MGYLEIEVIVAIYFISQLALDGPPIEVSNNQNDIEFFHKVEYPMPYIKVVFIDMSDSENVPISRTAI